MDVLHSLENVDIKASMDTIKKLEELKFSYSTCNVPGPGCDLDPSLLCFEGCACESVTSCDPSSCSCSLTDYIGRKLNSISLDRQIIYECNMSCKCADSCRNRLVQHGVCVQLEIFDTGLKGLGVRTLEAIKCGEFVCEYAGEVISRDEALKRTNHQEKMSEMNFIISVFEHFTGSNEKVLTFIDPKYRGNVGRFLNHSCEPNVKMFPVRVNSTVPHLSLFASRDISPGEELTFHYGGFSDLMETNLSKACYCGAASCKGFLPLDGTHIPTS